MSLNETLNFLLANDFNFDDYKSRKLVTQRQRRTDCKRARHQRFNLINGRILDSINKIIKLNVEKFIIE